MPLDLRARLSKYRISETRFNDEMSSLQEAGFSALEAEKLIVRKYSFNTVQGVLAYSLVLMEAPHHLTRAQIVRIASRDGGSKNLEAVLEHSKMLLSSGHSRESILKMVSASGGSKKLNQKRSFCDAFVDDLGIFGDLSEGTSSHLDDTPNIEASLPRQMNPIASSNHEEAAWPDGEDDPIPRLVILLDEVNSAKEADAARGAVLNQGIFSSPSMPGEEGACADRAQQSRERNVRMGG